LSLAFQSYLEQSLCWKLSFSRYVLVLIKVKQVEVKLDWT
jgi:hypothetical protein